jgi:phage baseplate assembly protein gpV
MTTLINTIQEIIRHEMNGLRIAEMGLVEAVYPHRDGGDNDNYGVDVRLKNSGLLLKRVPVATGHIGTAAIPNIGDLVLLTFQNGDVNQPIVIGRLYNDDDRPPANDSNEVIFRLPLEKPDDKSILGAIRNIEDKSPPREIIFEMPPKITVRITDGTVQATAGKTEMFLDQQGGSGGTVTVTSGRTKIVMNQDGAITIDAATSLSIKAAAALSLEGNTVSIKGNGSVKIESGAAMNIKSGAILNLQASGPAVLKGAVVKISGGAVILGS